MKKLHKLLAGMLIFALVGCQAAQKPMPPTEQIPAEEISTDTALAAELERLAKQVEGVDDSVAVVLKRDISLSLKVSGFHRLRLKQIRNDVHHKVRERVGEKYQIHVTTDKKLFAQLLKIKQDIGKGKLNTDLMKKFNKVNEDMKG